MGIADFVLSVLSGMLGSLLIVEWVTGCDPLSRFILRCAAARLPEPHCTEMLCAWLDDNQSIKSPTWKLLNAMHTYLFIPQLAKELEVELVRSRSARDLLAVSNENAEDLYERLVEVVLNLIILPLQVVCLILYAIYTIIGFTVALIGLAVDSISDKANGRSGKYYRTWRIFRK